MRSAWFWVSFGVVLLLFSFTVAKTGELEDLGSPEYFVREMASRKLEKKMTPELYIKLSKVKSKDLEVVRRIQRLKEEFELKRAGEYSISRVVDLKGYPDLPWIDSLPRDYTWKGLNALQLNCFYRQAAYTKGILQDGYPKWTDYRKATEVWLQDRLEVAVKDSLAKSKSEKEFRKEMDKEVKKIQQDVEAMILGDDKQCGGKERNPLRKGSKPDP